jgi:hypothetical protein
MASKHLAILAPLALALLVARGAAAQAEPVAPAAVPVATPPPAAPPPVTIVVPAPQVVQAPPQLVLAPEPAPLVAEARPVELTVPWHGPTGKGVSIGLEEGAWSGVWGSGLRVFVPFFEQIGGHNAGSFGMTVRGLVLTGANIPAPEAANHFGGRFELTGRSPVFLNLVRLYGGGGVEVLSPFGSGVASKALVGGGGHFGFEFFLNRRFSFFLEVGGHSGVDSGLPGGETVIAGMNVYPFFS